MKASKPRRRWKMLAVALGVAVLLLLLFVVAFVFNPLEGSLRDVRDIVPREVDFLLRKTQLAADFEGGRLRLTHDQLPAPAFWSSLTDTKGWQALQRGPLVSGMRRDYEGVLRQVRDGLLQVNESSGGFLDVGRDLVGREVLVAGYFEDHSHSPSQPLPQPWWCIYARVSWRLRAAWGLARWSIVQDQAKSRGVEIHNDGPLLVIRPAGSNDTFYAGRQLDCLMIANDKLLLEQAQRLADAVEGEEPFGQSAKYSNGVVEPIGRWAAANANDAPDALEFSIAPNTLDAFRRFSAAWPDAHNKDSMNERVLASFLNLKGWNSLTGALLFEPERLSVLGEIVLNSNMHTPFQSSFYRSERQLRKEWLDPFLRMVPDSACAAAALRMPAGEFLHAMYDALLQDEKDLLDERMRRCSLLGQPLSDTRDLIERLKGAFLPRTGFVFRRNTPDPEIAVTALSPVPQIAWLFWLRSGTENILQGFVEMLRHQASVFQFAPVYHLKVDGLPDPVTEFCHVQIPGTGEIAMIVFNDFFVISNSGPLIKDILRTRYSFGNARPMIQGEVYQRIERELPQALNGFVWLRGRNILPVLEDYRAASEAQNKEPDPEWMLRNRPAAEEVVRRQKYPRYQSLASMPEALRKGEFADAVTSYLKEQWSKGAAGLSSADLPGIDQLMAMAQLVDAAYLEVDLENNYIRFQGKVVARF